MIRLVLVRGSLTAVALAVAASSVLAQAPKPAPATSPAASAPAMAAASPATKAYMDYLAALKKAAKIEDLFPFLPAENKAMVEKTKPAERPQFFEMMKMMTLEAHTGVKVVKETTSPKGATLSLTGLNPDKSKATGNVEMVKEGGAWKVGQESWK